MKAVDCTRVERFTNKWRVVAYKVTVLKNEWNHSKGVINFLARTNPLHLFSSSFLSLFILLLFVSLMFFLEISFLLNILNGRENIRNRDTNRQDCKTLWSFASEWKDTNRCVRSIYAQNVRYVLNSSPIFFHYFLLWNSFINLQKP